MSTDDGGRDDETSARTEAEIREIVADELRAQQSSSTRRGVLKALGLGGAAAAMGGTAGAQTGGGGGGGASLDVGSVTPNTYRIAGNRYGGAAAARSELTSELGGGDAGARFAADDTGAEYYWTGSAWEQLPVEAPAINTEDSFSEAVHYLREFTIPDTRPQVQNAGQSLVSFADLTDWSMVQGTVNTVTTDSDKYLSALPTVELDANGAGSFVFRYEPASSFDLSDKGFSMAVRVPDGVDLTNELLRIDVHDTSGNRRDFRTQPKDRDHWLRYDFGIKSPDDAGFDPASIDYLDIRLGTESNLYISDLRTVDAAGDTSIVFQFDDGNPSVHDTALPIMQEYNMSGCAFVHPFRIEENYDSHMTLSELRTLKENGWEIGSHTYSSEGPGTVADVDEYEQEIAKAKRWLMNPPDGGEPFLPGAHHFVWVGGETIGGSVDGLDVVPKYHRTASVTKYGAFGSPLSSSMNVNRMQGDNVTDVTTLLDNITSLPVDTLVFNFHTVGNSSDSYLTESEFRTVVEKVAEIDAEVITTDTLWQRAQLMR